MLDKSVQELQEASEAGEAGAAGECVEGGRREKGVKLGENG